MKLVLLPPLGHDHKLFDPLLTLVNKENVLCLNYPYFDQNFSWDSPDLIEELAQFFAEKLKAFPRVDILGVSLGATLSLRIKEILGERCAHLFLVSSGGHKIANFRKEMILSHLNNLGEDAFLFSALEVGPGKSFSESDFKNHFHHDLTLPMKYWDHYTNILWSAANQVLGKKALVAMIRASIQVNYEHLLSQFQDDISIVWGEKDKVFSMRFYEKFKKVCPRASFHLFKEMGHFSPLETPSQFKDILRKYE